jgi:peptide/nickel transport system permease protein
MRLTSAHSSDARIIVCISCLNCFQSANVIGTFAMVFAIISEAALSFLGLGVPPEVPTWGSILANSRAYISYPGAWRCFRRVHLLRCARYQPTCDGMRDLLDPHLKRSGSGIG